MALFKTTIYSELTGEGVNPERWTNSFHFDVLGINSALDSAESAANALASQLINEARIWKITARSVDGGETRIRLVDIAGARTGMAVNLIPMFNAVRMTFSDEFLRSETFYLRGYILEANVQGTLISGELLTNMQTDVADGILGVLGLRGPNGETIVSATIAQQIQMRQLGWHRRTRPGFKRGWVPV